MAGGGSRAVSGVGTVILCLLAAGYDSDNVRVVGGPGGYAAV